jgi:signal transduction histidine kinase
VTADPRTPGTQAAGRAKLELERALDLRLAPAQALVAGVFIGWAAIALKAPLNQGLGVETGYVLLMAGSVVAAWIGGWVGGLTATVVATGLNAAIFLSGDDVSDATTRLELILQGLYLLVASGTVALVASRRASRDRLAHALDEVAALVENVAARDARLEIMLSASGTGFWEWDVATGELTWSEAIFRQHGLEPSDHAPDFATYLTMIHPEDRPAFQDAITAALDGDDAFSLDFRLVWSDESIHWTHGAARVFRDADGRPLRLIGTGQDITERRRVEAERDELILQERRAGEFREAFIDVISHELRTPITTILGLAQLLTRPGRFDDPEQRTAMLHDVRAESERLHRLVEDLLVLSRVERGHLDIDPEPLQPHRMLAQIVEHEAPEWPSITIGLTAPDDLPVVLGEATYVSQIMRNLLGNAAKYTPIGSTVMVDARLEDDAVAFRVSDDGPGVPSDSRGRLFDLFYRDPDSARTVAGSGIGLFVCASLVEAMGGRIWVTDAPGGGAEFGFTLRIADLDEADGGSDPAADVVADASAHGTVAVDDRSAATQPEAVSPGSTPSG